MRSDVAVLDASVGVKWFKPELGTEDAVALLQRTSAGDLTLVVNHLFIYEVLGVVYSRRAGAFTLKASVDLTALRLAAVGPEPTVVEAAVAQADALGCDLYDAFSAGLASLLDAPLYSGDRRAHERYPGVVLIG